MICEYISKLVATCCHLLAENMRLLANIVDRRLAQGCKKFLNATQKGHFSAAMRFTPS